MFLQGITKHRRELYHVLTRSLVVVTNQPVKRVERVEKEMGVGLISQRVVSILEILDGEVFILFHSLLILDHQIYLTGHDNGSEKQHQIFHELDNRVMVRGQMPP